jgi:hypothetical protein
MKKSWEKINLKSFMKISLSKINLINLMKTALFIVISGISIR